MSTESKSSSGGFGLSTILFVVFLTLKLTNVIDWSWWWVTSPLWISAIFFVFCMLIIAIIAALVAIIKK